MPRDLRAINGCSPATDRNFRTYKNSTPSCCHAVTRIILGNWIRILSFVNILANSSGVNEARLGRNAISGSFTIIGRLRHSRRIVSGRWSHFSQPSSAGCNAGLFREALHEVYIPRIKRGNASFAANLLGARGPLLSVLVHFFEHGRWGSLVEMGVKGQSLTAEDQLFILMQAGLYLSAKPSAPQRSRRRFR